MGYPSSFTEELGDRILSEYAQGRSLEAIALEPWCPVGAHQIRNWGDKVPGFREKFSEAKARYADALASSTLTVLDTERDPMRARVSIQARQWLAGKLRPQSYGERIEVVAEHRISLREAMSAGRSRLLPQRDQTIGGEALEPGMIDVTPHTTTDQISEDAALGSSTDLPDWMD